MNSSVHEPKVTINPPFTQAYLDMQRMSGEAIVAAAADNVVELHRLNHELLRLAINLTQYSFFGVTITRINEQAKSDQQNQVDPPDTHPV